MQDYQQRFDYEYNEKERTRLENDQTLLAKLTQIESGQDIPSLERFAKAYLGLYLDMDNCIIPAQRIQILANPQLAAAIEQGFKAVLNQTALPNAKQFADSMLDEEPFAIGYILLTAMDQFVGDQVDKIEALPEDTLIAAVCSHYAYKIEMPNKWLSHAIEHRQTTIANALKTFWQQLAQRHTDHLPGLLHIIEDRNNDLITQQVVLPILSTWTNCRKSTLRVLLRAAIRTGNHAALLPICESALDTWNTTEPNRYMSWLATAFFLAPSTYAKPLAEYTGRSKEKILPLLDFSYAVLHTDKAEKLNMHIDSYAQLLRIIAPKFTPQEDRYGNLCDNTLKVMFLFYCLTTTKQPDAISIIEKLASIRVMKLYNAILNYVIEVNRAQAMPSLEQFMSALLDKHLVRTKMKWSDQGH